MFSNLWQDMRYAVRGFRRNPAFTMAAFLAIALGIGVNTGIFSILSGLVLRELPLPAADRLISIYQRFDGIRRSVHGSRSMFTTPEYRAYREGAASSVAITSYSTGLTATFGGSNPQLLEGILVGCNYFSVLELPLAAGAGFNQTDCENPETSHEVVLSHDVWANRYGSNPGIIGSEILLNRQPFRVAGVAPSGFYGTEILRAEFFAPLASQKTLISDNDFFSRDDVVWLTLIGRRNAGVTPAQVRANLDVIAARFDQQQPGRRTTLIVQRASAIAMPEMRDAFLLVGSVVMAAFGMVLLIACANVANLLLARAAGRTREIAVRLCVGSSRGRLIQQLLTESILLSLGGGIVGSLLALWSFRIVFARVISSLPAQMPPIAIDTTPDIHVLLFALALTFVTGIIFGLAPALTASKPDLYSAIKQDSAGLSRRSGNWLRGGLVGIQVAVCMVLMVSAGLMLRGLYAAHTADPGFTYENVTIASYDLTGGGYDEARATSFQQTLRERVGTLPGIQAVEQVRNTPLSPGRTEFMVGVPGRPERYRMGVEVVSSGYFDAVDIPIVLGRTFASNELRNQSGRIVVTESTARRYWPAQNPIGQRFTMQIAPNQDVELEVIGVAKDAHLHSFAEIETSFMYMPASPRQQAELQLLVRSNLDFAQVANGIREAARQLDPALVVRVYPLEDNLEFWRTVSRLVAGMSGSLGTLALLLASIGVYGVVSYAVSRRVREMGIRIALGASPRGVLRLMVVQALRPVLIGLSVGLLAALAVSKILESVLFGISTHDAIAFVGAGVFLLAVALLATWIPSRRVIRLDPLKTLRYE